MSFVHAPPPPPPPPPPKKKGGGGGGGGGAGERREAEAVLNSGDDLVGGTGLVFLPQYFQLIS